MTHINKTHSGFFFCLTLFSIAGYFSQSLYLPSLPAIMDIFNSTAKIAQWSFAAWFLGIATSILFINTFVERVGARRLLLSSGLFFCLASFLLLKTQSLPFFVIARFLQGMAISGLIVTSLHYLKQYDSTKESINKQQTLRIIAALSLFLGPLIGGYIFIQFSWAINFWLSLSLAVIGTIGLCYYTPKQTLQPTVSSKLITSNYYQLIKNPACLRNLLTYSLSMSAVIAFLGSSPFIFITQLNISPRYYGLIPFIIFAAYLSSLPQAKPLSERIGKTKTIILGLVIAGLASIALLFCATAWPFSTYSLLVPLIAYGLSLGLILTPLKQRILSNATNNTTAANTLLYFFIALFSGLGSVSMGLLYNNTSSSISKNVTIMALASLLIYLLTFKAEHTKKIANTAD